MGNKRVMSTLQKGIHYFPGHMKKALNSLGELIKSVDLVIEVVDARAPFSSRNPFLKEIIGQKAHLLFLTKVDYADPLLSKKWLEYYQSLGISAASSNLKENKAIDIINKESASLLKNKREKERKLGMKPQPARIIVIGVPNVGKSTLINNLAGKSIAIAGNKPGVTRANQWIKLSNGFILLDTPGILPLNYEDKDCAIKLALTGSIKEDVLPIDFLADSLLNYLREYYPQILAKRYDILDLRNINNGEVLLQIGKKRGYLLSGNIVDTSKVSSLIIKEFRDGEIGRITLEIPHVK